jgi:hypothetical protein
MMTTAATLYLHTLLDAKTPPFDRHFPASIIHLRRALRQSQGF